ncbi:MAG TPA: hypothetical protein VLY03_06805 [Bacteroidota bacterium]|nr:hypothetical protein [Bacteroidota bacterium]
MQAVFCDARVTVSALRILTTLVTQEDVAGIADDPVAVRSGLDPNHRRSVPGLSIAHQQVTSELVTTS